MKLTIWSTGSINLSWLLPAFYLPSFTVGKELLLTGRIALNSEVIAITSEDFAITSEVIAVTSDVIAI